jgi:hypothetical protein
MRPIHTIARFDSRYLFSTPFGPAAMQLTAPSTGSSAHQPGKALVLRVMNRPSTSRPTPTMDCTCFVQGRGSVETDAALVAFAACRRIAASNPPAISSHARDSGE